MGPTKYELLMSKNLTTIKYTFLSFSLPPKQPCPEPALFARH